MSSLSPPATAKTNQNEHFRIEGRRRTMSGGSRLPLLSLGNALFTKWRLQARPLSTKKPAKDDAYRQLENLDMMTAAKILFSEPSKKKTFGLDFHLVQLFFACMPSLAVYLVAQYARYEIRRMEAEVEQKKKAEEEKAIELAVDTAEDGLTDTELFKVKERLEALENVVKEIADETKKRSETNAIKATEGSKEGNQEEQGSPGGANIETKPDGSSTVKYSESRTLSQESGSNPIENGASSQNSKK